jgi:putative aminopeptidase FrvX
MLRKGYYRRVEQLSLRVCDLENVDLLKKLVEARGTPGFEDEVREVMVRELRDCADEIEVDPLGNVVAIQKGESKGPKVMLAAHMDEVGLIVKTIDNDGFVLFEPNGVIDDRMLPTQWVVIHTRKGPVYGVVGVKARHLLTPEEMARAPMFRDMWIDVGALDRKAVEELGVRPGDPVTFDRGLRVIGKGNFVLARALDDRIGCVIMIQALKRLRKIEHEATVYAVGTVMEEVGARGAGTSAFAIKPDVGIAFDTSHGVDLAVTPKWSAVRVGHGPTIRLMDMVYSAVRGGITPPRLRDLVVRAAEEERIPHQLDVMSGTFLDAASISLSGEGVPSVGILVARWNAHSPAEVACLDDVENAVKLTVAIVRRTTTEFVSGFRRKVK